ncbi:unnamed protein product, partial [Mesorhabditis belari]|uniref:Uncharacterized protein n=1 Tax=Mesorhabditis belari TaxID=2138241 RepID=A0AAF3EZ71_9BILA
MGSVRGTSTLPKRCCADVFAAVEEKHEQCLEGMTRDEMKKRDPHGQTGLHIAAKIDNFEAIKYFCSALPELRDVSSNIGEIPALISAGVGSLRSMETILQGNSKEATKMAMHRDINGTSSLMAAVARGDNEMAFLLLKRFGKPLAMLPNKAQMIPLHVAAAQGNIEFIRIATKYGSEMVHSRDEFGCTPCVYAVQGGCLSSVRYLVEKAHSEVGSVSNRGQSLLHISCLSGHEHITRWLLVRMGSDAALWTTNDQANAIHCASFAGSVPVLTVLLSEWSRRKRSHVLSLRDSRGNTPLHLTAINNHMDSALYLLENGADPVLVNGAGHAAQAIANLRGHHDMARLLAEHSDLNRSKKRSAKKSKSAADLRVVSPTSSTLPSPIDMDRTARREPKRISQRMNSPLQMSSGYDSSGASEAGVDIVERRPMKYIEDDEGIHSSSPSLEAKKDQEAQTEIDHLTDHIKVLDDREWSDAVAHIDRVLEEVGQSHVTV